MIDFPSLESEIRRRIAVAGPMPVNEYMTLCLTDDKYGYYTARDPFGAGGDFVTAPEVSQMFGEMVGLWMVAVWKQMGSPENLRVVELGPGRGTMMKDALRAAKVMPAFLETAVIHLVEISPALMAYQKRTLEPTSMPVSWHSALADVPAGPVIVLANEFFDALPISQAVKTERGWHERQVEIDSAGYLAFSVASNPIPHFDSVLPPAVRNAPEDSIFEWRTDNIAMELGTRLARNGGAALVIDYGHDQSATGDTLQAVGRHAYANPLSAPGSIDLTAHVDFQALGNAIEAMGTNGFGPITQSQFLRRLGIVTRAASLKAKAADAAAANIDSELRRLISEGEAGMGALFKAAAYAHPSLGVPPGFET